ncbi:hypothetical protein AMECASPLE_017792, partial [Ameca splendens]
IFWESGRRLRCADEAPFMEKPPLHRTGAGHEPTRSANYKQRARPREQIQSSKLSGEQLGVSGIPGSNTECEVISTNDSGVIYKLQQFHCRSSEMQSFVYKEKWGQSTPLGGTGADGSCAREDALQPPDAL